MKALKSTINAAIILAVIILGGEGAFAGVGLPGDNASSDTSLTVGLALSGGGARGIAHIGVIIALEENNIPIDLIAGTSMGSIVGGLYAVGFSGREMQRLVNEIDWVGLFDQNPDPKLVLVSKRYGMMEPIVRLRFRMWDIYLPFGMNNGQRISEELFYLTAAGNFAAKSDFDSLVVPFQATAVDVASAELLFLKQGDLAQAIHASMAIPMLFSPARVGDRMLVDGGVLDILPTDAARDMGADIIIACDLEGLFPLGQEPKHFAEVAIHTLDITIRELKKGNVKLADVLIEPDLGDHSSSDYSGLDSLIRLGYEATMAKMDEIKKLVPAQREQTKTKRRLDKQLINKAKIAYIRVKGAERVRLPVITGEFAMKEGEVFNLDLALHGVKKIYATGLFENVWLEPEYLSDNLIGINIHVIEKYPRTIGFGLNYRSEEGTGGFVQIVHFNFFGWGERFMPLLRVGDLYKRAGLEIVNDRFFATPLTVHNGIYYEKEHPYIYKQNGDKAESLQMDRVVAQFSMGVQPSGKLMFTTGVRGERVWLGQNHYLELKAQTLEHWSVFGQFLHDNTDDRYFPTNGVRFLLNGESIVEFKHAAKPFTKVFGEFDCHFSPWQRHTFSINLFAGASTSGLPIYEQFRIGGPLQAPGYHRNELWSNDALRGALAYRFKFFRIWHFMAGVSMLSVDRAENFTYGANVGIVAATPVGPFRLFYGRSDDAREQVYFSFGYDF